MFPDTPDKGLNISYPQVVSIFFLYLACKLNLSAMVNGNVLLQVSYFDSSGYLFLLE